MKPIQALSICRKVARIALLGFALLTSQICWSISLNSASDNQLNLMASGGGVGGGSVAADYNELDQSTYQPSSQSSSAAASPSASNYRSSEPNQILVSNLPSGPMRGSFRNTIRYITPYTLQHLLASRFKNLDYPDLQNNKRQQQQEAPEGSNVFRNFDWPSFRPLDGVLPQLSSPDNDSQPKQQPRHPEFKVQGQFVPIKTISGWKIPLAFQYYTKGSEFLGGPGR